MGAASATQKLIGLDSILGASEIRIRCSGELQCGLSSCNNVCHAIDIPSLGLHGIAFDDNFTLFAGRPRKVSGEIDTALDCLRDFGMRLCKQRRSSGGIARQVVVRSTL